MTAIISNLKAGGKQSEMYKKRALEQLQQIKLIVPFGVAVHRRSICMWDLWLINTHHFLVFENDQQHIKEKSMASSQYFFILAIVATLVPSILATEFVVGDDKGWTVNFDCQAWAQGKEFYVGDTLGKLIL